MIGRLPTYEAIWLTDGALMAAYDDDRGALTDWLRSCGIDPDEVCLDAYLERDETRGQVRYDRPVKDEEGKYIVWGNSIQRERVVLTLEVVPAFPRLSRMVAELRNDEPATTPFTNGFWPIPPPNDNPQGES